VWLGRRVQKPHSLGGRTELDNLVTSCYSCNFGKAEYTLKQLGIDDPTYKILDEAMAEAEEKYKDRPANSSH